VREEPGKAFESLVEPCEFVFSLDALCHVADHTDEADHLGGTFRTAGGLLRSAA